MSDSPGAPPPDPDDSAGAQSAYRAGGSSWFQPPRRRALHHLLFRAGTVSLIYPWTSSWTDNYFAWVLPGTVQTSWHTFWNNPYVRGGVSGLGIVNVWVALTEVFGMFARRARSQQTGNNRLDGPPHAGFRRPVRSAAGQPALPLRHPLDRWRLPSGRGHAGAPWQGALSRSLV